MARKRSGVRIRLIKIVNIPPSTKAQPQPWINDVIDCFEFIALNIEAGLVSSNENKMSDCAAERVSLQARRTNYSKAKHRCGPRFAGAHGQVESH